MEVKIKNDKFIFIWDNNIINILDKNSAENLYKKLENLLKISNIRETKVDNSISDFDICELYWEETISVPDLFKDPKE